MAKYNLANIAIPPAVKILLIANIGVFLLQSAMGDALIPLFALWPLDLHEKLATYGVTSLFEPWQLLTYAFLHGSFFHIFLNMYALWMFGSRMEMVWGSRAFVIYYFVCVIGAGLTQLLFTSYSGDVYPTIGASGGVFGILLAFGMTFPNERLLLVFPPVVLKAKWFVLLFGAIELFSGVTGTAAGVAHFAHLGGMLFGFFLLLRWRKHPLQR